MEVLVFLIVLALLDFLFVAFFRRLKKGRYKIHSNTADVFEFSTDVGGFSIDRANRVFRYATPAGRGSVSLDSLEKLEFGLVTNYALLQEIFFGFDILDFLPRYQDSDYWYSIAVRTREGEQIPVYIAGQYKQREFLMTWYINLQQRVLEALGLFVDVHDFSRAVVDSVSDAFEASGVEVRVGAMSRRVGDG